MKKIEIATGKATIVVMDLPQDAKRVVVRQNENQSDFWYDIGDVSHMVNLPSGHWKHLGHHSQLTEVDWMGIVDSLPDPWLHQFRNFRDYTKEHKFPKDSYLFKTATESGISLLKANGVVLENPFGEEPQLSDYIFEDHIELVDNPKEYDHDLFHKDHDEWQQAQKQVWSNPQIFIKLKGAN